MIISLLSYQAAVTIAGSIAIFAAAFAVLRKAGRGASGVVEFVDQMRNIPDISGLVAGQARIEAAQAESATTRDINAIVQSFAHAEQLMVSSAIEFSVATFKIHTMYCPVPSYVIATSTDGQGDFIWANQPWYDLHGIDEVQARSGQFWSCIHPDDRAAVRLASDGAASRRVMFSVDYRLVNHKTGVVKKVHAQALPLVPHTVKDGDQVLYLGAILVDD